MRRRLIPGWFAVLVLATLLLPNSVAASGGYDYGLVHNHCGGAYNWTTFFKAREIAAGTTGANKLTIDSSAQAFGPGDSHWFTTQTWPRISTTFTPDGSYHHLSLARKVRGGIDERVRIVFKLSAWDHGLLAWSRTIRSTAC